MSRKWSEKNYITKGLTSLRDDFFRLLQSGEHTDVTFLVGGVRITAHRLILASRCEYFRSLLFGDMKEAHSDAVIPLPDVTPESFRVLLEYMYSGEVCLSDLSLQVMLRNL